LLNKRKRNDADKSTRSLGYGTTLITVPFWWDRKESSLVSTIRKLRPDLMENLPQTAAAAIPETIPSALKEKLPYSASLELDYNDFDPKGWYVYDLRAPVNIG
jgi:hypothetical protein